MKTEEEIRKKKDLFNLLLEETEEYDIGRGQKRKMLTKLNILNWVLDENSISLEKMPSVNYLELAKTRILKSIEEKPKVWFSVDEVVNMVGVSKQTAQKYLRELDREGFLEVDVKIGELGSPKIYKIKLDKNKK